MAMFETVILATHPPNMGMLETLGPCVRLTVLSDCWKESQPIARIRTTKWGSMLNKGLLLQLGEELSSRSFSFPLVGFFGLFLLLWGHNAFIPIHFSCRFVASLAFIKKNLLSPLKKKQKKVLNSNPQKNYSSKTKLWWGDQFSKNLNCICRSCNIYHDSIELELTLN